LITSKGVCRKVVFAGLELTSVLDLDHRDYAAKHLKAVNNFCNTECSLCPKCSSLLPTDREFFNCFDCERYPPAYGNLKCDDLPQTKLDKDTKKFCKPPRVSSLKLLDVVDKDSTFRKKMEDFYNGDDPMGRYRTTANEQGKGRVRSRSSLQMVLAVIGEFVILFSI
jgi:hypothetical protein